MALIVSHYGAEDADLCLRPYTERLLPQITADAGLARVYGEIEIPSREVLSAWNATAC